MSGTTLDESDGGPAFPHLHESSQRINETEMHGGMALRDYFAARAMPMLAAEFYRQDKQLMGGTVADLVAPVAYAYADAMLKARVK